MLHQPASTFEPSLPVPSTAQPFDIELYLKRARELGTMVFPAISSNGRRLVGYCAYLGFHFGDDHSQLKEEFGIPPTAVIFDGLCEDFGVDPADAFFNEKVSSICHDRNRASIEGDARLIELCGRAKARLEKDRKSISRVCDLTEQFEKLQPEKPTRATSDGQTIVECQSAAEMRAKLPDILVANDKAIVDAYRARIAKVAAYEKERDRLRRKIGLSRAQSFHRFRWFDSQAAIRDIADLPATTMSGLAHKAALLPAWKYAGYELVDEGEILALSIAEDARMLGTGGGVRRDGIRTQPSAQAHH